MNENPVILAHLNDHLATVNLLREQIEHIQLLAQTVIHALANGHKVLFFGNGGSAADAQHLAAELVVRFKQNRRALPGIALTTDTSILTAHSNDFGFETVFARQIEALGQKGDMVIGISTSGTSPSVIEGLKQAKAQGCVTMAFTAQGGGQCAEIADYTFRAPSESTARAQECHLLVGHIICDLVEEWLQSEFTANA